MQYNTVGTSEISRLGLGTKRFPTDDSSRVVHLDTKAATEIYQAAVEGGVNFFDTSYSNHKGEAESFLGTQFAASESPAFVCTTYFEMIDPRFEYVFQKQRKKLEKECIDFYAIEGINDINKEINVDSGAIDFFFERKEAGEIAQIGFSSDLSAPNLREFLKRYPWDFVRMRINFYDWFEGSIREAYDVADELDVPVFAHGSLRTGLGNGLKKEAMEPLRELDASRSSIEWALLFVKSLENVRNVSCNAYSVEQIKTDVAVFSDDVVLSDSEMDALKEAARLQKALSGPKR